MSANLGPRWEDDEDYSPARMDAKGILRDTGTNIVAIAVTRQIGLAIPTDTSGGLIKNVTYYVDYDSSFNRINFLPIFAKHLHNADTDQAGGRMLDIELANAANYIRIDVPMLVSAWDTAATGGTLTAQNDGEYTDGGYYLQLKTTTTTNNLITANLRGCGLNFSEKSMFQLKAKLSHNSNLLVRMGNNIDRVQDTQDTARRQYGIEGCDGHGTNYVLINANGNTSSLTTTASTAVLNPSSAAIYKITHIPATECRFYENGTSVAVSTTNVASSGNSTQAGLLRLGLKLPTGTTEKILKFWNVQIIGDSPEYS